MLRFLVTHPTVGPLLWLLVLGAGLFSLFHLTTQLWPSQPIDTVFVRGFLRGATPEAMNEQWVSRVEPALRELDGVIEVEGFVWSGGARLLVQFARGTEMSLAYQQVTQAIAQITDLPADAEPPRITLDRDTEVAARILVSGPFSWADLGHHTRQIAATLRDAGLGVRLLADGRREIAVEPDAHTLQQQGLAVNELATALRRSLRDVPAGELADGVRVRTQAAALTAQDIAEWRVARDGVPIENAPPYRVGDLATVAEVPVKGRLELRRHGHTAFELEISRGEGGDLFATVSKAQQLVAQLQQILPSTLRVELYSDETRPVRQWLGLLVANGATGLLLVLVMLTVFLHRNVAVWVAAGIPVALLGALSGLFVLGETLNLASLFGLVLVVGVIVDDAIVVAERVTTRHRQGLPPQEAAIVGAQELFWPITAALLTTVVAFLPLLWLDGRSGLLAGAMALAVMTAIVASWVECFCLLPRHLAHALDTRSPSRFRRAVDSGFGWLQQGLQRTVRTLIAWRYLTATVAVVTVVLAVGLLRGGHVAFVNLPEPAAERLFATVELGQGATRDDTSAVLQVMERALDVALTQLHGNPTAAVTMVYGGIGTQFDRRGRRGGESRDELGSVAVELATGIDAVALQRGWLAELRRQLPPQVTQFDVFTPARFADSSRPLLRIDLSGGDLAALQGAAAAIMPVASDLVGVNSVTTSLRGGDMEAVVILNERGHRLGFTPDSLGQQLRAALQGVVVREFTEDDEIVKVRVRLPSNLLNWQDFYVRAPEGQFVAVDDVATITAQPGAGLLYRRNGLLYADVRIEYDGTRTNPQALRTALETGGLTDIRNRFGLQSAWGGELVERQAALDGALKAALVSAVLIYGLLALIFGDYGRPLLVMTVMPLALGGAIVGHALLGVPMNLQTYAALIGLGGLVVNEAIMWFDELRQLPTTGATAWAQASAGRLRAIMLTTGTTVLGLLPIVITGADAPLLHSMAVALVFGLLAAALGTLAVLPAVVAIVHDVAGYADHHAVAEGIGHRR